MYEVMQHFIDKCAIKHIKISAYHLQSNGYLEHNETNDSHSP